jgi:hypothetical protein
MALLFNDPLAFLPVDSMAHSQAIGGSGGHHNGGLRMLFPNWNHSSSGGGFDPAAARSDIHPIGTFNQPQQSAIQQQRQLDQLEEVSSVRNSNNNNNNKIDRFIPGGSNLIINNRNRLKCWNPFRSWIWIILSTVGCCQTGKRNI